MNETREIGDSEVATLRAIRAAINAQGFPPTMDALAKARGLSPSGVRKHVASLVLSGALSKQPNMARGVALTNKGRLVLKNRRAK